MMSRKEIDEIESKILSSENMYAFDDISQENFKQLSEGAQQKLNSISEKK